MINTTYQLALCQDTVKLHSKIFCLSTALRREFETPPYSQQLQEGRQAELRCYPPRGQPEARVTHWLKNGVVIDSSKDSNFIQSSSGHLLIHQARLEDSANYTCVASNGVIERKSKPATVTVYGKSRSSLIAKCNSFRDNRNCCCALSCAL